MTFAIISPDPATVTDANPFGNLVRTTSPGVEEYMGETFKVERREIASFASRRGYRVVWCWEVLSGPAQGMFGGKCADRREATKWAKYHIRVVGPELAAQPASQNNA